MLNNPENQNSRLDGETAIKSFSLNHSSKSQSKSLTMNNNSTEQNLSQLPQSEYQPVIVSPEVKLFEEQKKLYKKYQKVLTVGVPKVKFKGYYQGLCCNVAGLSSKGEMSEEAAKAVLVEFYRNSGIDPVPSNAQLIDDIRKAKNSERMKEEAKSTKLTSDTSISTLSEIYQNRLAWNEMTKIVELDGEPQEDLSGAYLDIGTDFGITVSKDLAQDSLIRLAKSNPYHPVKEYLKSVSETLNSPSSVEDALSTLKGIINNFGIFGDYEVSGTIKCFLSAVYRVFEPGCKADLMLILRGTQGLGKSTLLNTLAVEGFIDLANDPTTKDGMLEMHKGWIIELAEVEKFTRTKEAFATKSIITRRVDQFRAPYARNTVSNSRNFILVGTTNEDDLFLDPTGNRRYIVVEVTKKVDIAYVEQVRDEFWANLFYLYQKKYQHYLTQEEFETQTELNKGSVVTDSRITLVEDYISSKEYVTLLDVVEQALDIERKAPNFKRAEMDVAKMLKQLGWNKKQCRIDGKKKTYWFPPEDLDTRNTINDEEELMRI